MFVFIFNRILQCFDALMHMLFQSIIDAIEIYGKYITQDWLKSNAF